MSTRKRFLLIAILICDLLLIITPTTILAQHNVQIINDGIDVTSAVYWSADGTKIVVAGDDLLEAWDVTTGEKVGATTELLFADIPLEYSTKPQRIAWTTDGQYAAVVDSKTNAILIYERGNTTPLYTVEYSIEEFFWLEGVVWRADGAIWTPTGNSQKIIRLHQAEDGAVTGEITLDTGQYTYQVDFYGLQFEPDGDAFAVGRYSAGVSDVHVYDSTTLEEQIIIEDETVAPFPLSFNWLEPDILNYCINPVTDQHPVSESITLNLETGTTTHNPYCIYHLSPDGRYFLNYHWWDAELEKFDSELQVLDLATVNVVDSLRLADYTELDEVTLSEVVRFRWGVGGIIIYRATNPTIWQPLLPSE